MKNRKLLLVLSLLLALTLSLTGTLAYLTDTDSDVNVMTLGNVKIEQHEKTEAGDDFQNNQPLFPAYYPGDVITWDDHLVGEIEKYVTVENTGKSDAYARTWVAFEKDMSMIHIQWADGANPVEKGSARIAAEINGEMLVQEYDIFCVTYNDKLEPGQTYAVLNEFAMDKHAGNDYVASFGDTYDVLVLTQAVQTNNLTQLGSAEAALNEAFTANHPWVNGAEGGVEQGTTLKAEIEKALKDNYAKLTLKTDAEWETGAAIGSTPLIPENAALKTLIIDGNGKTLTATGKGVGALHAANGGTITFKNMTIKDNSVSYAENNWEYGYLEFAGKLVFENVEFVNAVMFEGDEVEFINCTFNSNKDSEYGVWISDGVAAFKNCTFTGPRGLKTHEAYGSEVKSIVVDNCTFMNLTKKPGVAIGTVNADTSVTIKNSEFIGCQAGDQGLYIYETDTDVNSFAFDAKMNNTVANELVEISTAADLFAFAKDVNENNKNFSMVCVVLTADIDLNNATWTPIGQTGATQFNGIFDGQGHTISNLKVDSLAQTGEHYSSGLFGWLNAATVKNVNIDGANIQGNHNVAVIAGYLETSGCTVSNCHVTNATVVGKHANNDACGDKVGVIVGHAGNAGVKVQNCSAKTCTVTAGRDAGQIVGAAKPENVTGCSAEDVTVTAGGDCTGANINNTVIGRSL